jgi:hypothetical protein
LEGKRVQASGQIRKIDTISSQIQHFNGSNEAALDPKITS